jgi:putative DNA primase/helicase
VIATDDAVRPIKPNAPRPILENIPVQLRELPQWVNWRYEFRDDDWTKVPCIPRTGANAKSNDPSTWATFDESARHAQRFDGLGFQFGDSGFVGVDLDDCRDPVTGKLTPFAEKVVERFNTYAEVSPSGEGVKLFLRGTWNGSGKNRLVNGTDRIEVYPRGRYFTVTGAKLPGAPDIVRECQPELDALYAEHFAPKPAAVNGTNGYANGNSIGHDRSRIIERARKYIAKMDPAISGQRGHDRAFHTSCVLVLGFGLSVDEAWPLICEWNLTCQPPWSEKDLRHKLDDADKQPGPRGTLIETNGSTRAGTITVVGESQPIDPLSVAAPEGQTDLANSRRFVKLYGDRARYSHAWNKWTVWDEARWKLDDDGAVMRLGKSVADSVWAEARLCNDPAALRFAARTAQDRNIRAMLSLAASELVIRLDEVDRDPFLLNCPNGTVNLRTGEIRSHRREDFLTKVTAAAFNPEAGSHTWDRALEAIFDGRGDVIKFMQRFLGYALTGDVREQVFPVGYGVGANGKSSLVEGFMNAVGPDYTAKAAPNLLLAKRGDSHPTELADLFGKRFVATVETENDRRLNESLMKELTGTDTMKARRLYENYWEFKPTWKLLLCTNHKPTIRGTDHGVWRRIRLVPFTQVFDGDKRDKALPEKFRAEAEGILAWAVRGCLAWQREGLGEPAAVREATAGYRMEQDVVGQFINERCQLGDGQTVRAKDLRLAFEDWASDAGQPMVQARRFGQELTTHGVERYTNNGVHYRGIGLKP